MEIIAQLHRYRKSPNRLRKVCYAPATSAVLIGFFSSFIAAAINSTNEANKVQPVCAVKQYIYLDVYAQLSYLCCSKLGSRIGNRLWPLQLIMKLH